MDSTGFLSDTRFSSAKKGVLDDIVSCLLHLTLVTFQLFSCDRQVNLTQKSPTIALKAWVSIKYYA